MTHIVLDDGLGHRATLRGEREGELSVLEHHVLCRARERLVEEGRRIGFGLLLLLLLQRLLLGLLLFGFDRTERVFYKLLPLLL